jgi:hypothetical protein
VSDSPFDVTVVPDDLSDEDGEVMRRWFAGEATEAEMQDVVRRYLYAQLPDHGCPTEGCKGDARYAAPGRGHIEGCTHRGTLA